MLSELSKLVFEIKFVRLVVCVCVCVCVCLIYIYIFFLSRNALHLELMMCLSA